MMSKLHSEAHSQDLGLRVRVKLVDLYGTVTCTEKSVSVERVASVLAIMGQSLGAGEPPSAKAHGEEWRPHPEVCMSSGEKVPAASYERHVEQCRVCANRVELQVDFVENLELAVYQRQSAPMREKVHGAMLVSAPALNFAICGEIEPV